MRTVMNRGTASALAVGVLCLGLALPGTASADQVDAVQLQVCNNNPRLMAFFVVGFNQYHEQTGSQFWEVPPNSCTTAWNYWWQSNRSVELNYQRSDIGRPNTVVYIHAQDDGATWTCSTS